MWLKDLGFKELIRGWWQGLHFRGTASFILAQKLKAIKENLKVWNREVFGKIDLNKSVALKQVSFWDDQEQQRPLSMVETVAKKEAKEEYKKWVLMEESHWRQKSREIWLKEGDRNTGFFHRMANSHRRWNTLSRIKINDTWLTEDQEIQRGIANYFKQFLSDSEGWRPSIEGLMFKSIGNDDAERLEHPFSEEEVLTALTDLNGDKAPGPDGFTLAFWQFSWEFIKEEVLGYFSEFYHSGTFVRSLNATFVVLIPKKGGAEDIRDFRPISLVGGLYKLLAKVLANRLKTVVGKVVSETQNAFIKGRQILDAALIANEAIDSLLKRKESGVLCKLDIEKGFDSINWNFLLAVLNKMGFGRKWIV